MNPRAPIEMDNAAWKDSPFGRKCRHRMRTAGAMNTSPLEEDVGEDSHASGKVDSGSPRGRKASQDVRIRSFLDDISRLRRLIPLSAASMAAEVDLTTQRAQAITEEFSVRNYDGETEQVLKQLLNPSTKNSSVC